MRGGPLRRFGARHARRRPDRQQRRALGQPVPGRGAAGEVRRHQGAQRRRLGQDQRRHHGDRIRHQVPASAGRAGHQPVARPRHLYARDPRSARAGRGTSLRGRDRGRRRGRQQYETPEHVRGHHVAGQRALRAHDRRGRHQPHAGAFRRRRGRLQRPGSDVVRRLRQAGFRGARLASDLGHRRSTSTLFNEPSSETGGRSARSPTRRRPRTSRSTATRSCS